MVDWIKKKLVRLQIRYYRWSANRAYTKALAFMAKELNKRVDYENRDTRKQAHNSREQ